MSYWKPLIWSLAAGFAAGFLEGTRRVFEERLDEEDRNAWMAQNPPPPPRPTTTGEGAAGNAPLSPSSAPSHVEEEDNEESVPSSLSGVVDARMPRLGGGSWMSAR